MKIDKLKIFIDLMKDKNRLRKILFFGGILALVIYAFFSSYGIVNTLMLQREQIKLVRSLKAEKDAQDSLRKYIHLLRYDTLHIEKVAREKYGLVKPGEKIFILDTNFNK